jgi:hypothetical protein
MQGRHMTNPFQEQLDTAFPDSTDEHVIRGVTEGIMLADKIIENEPFLRTLVGQDLRGHLRRAGILFRLHGMATDGELPFQSSMIQMPRGNWHWVELRSQNIRSHVCRTDGPALFPTDTPTRQDDRLSNQGDLFLIDPALTDISVRSAWLMFGMGDSGALGHLCWGMPNAKSDIWLARTNIMRRVEAKGVGVRIEAPSKSLGLKFKQHIEESLGENGERTAADND